MLLEIGDYLPGILLTEHRKTANSFRDKCMLQIFQLSLNCLNTLYSGGIFFFSFRNEFLIMYSNKAHKKKI